MDFILIILSKPGFPQSFEPSVHRCKDAGTPGTVCWRKNSLLSNLGNLAWGADSQGRSVSVKKVSAEVPGKTNSPPLGPAWLHAPTLGSSCSRPGLTKTGAAQFVAAESTAAEIAGP